MKRFTFFGMALLFYFASYTVWSQVQRRPIPSPSRTAPATRAPAINRATGTTARPAATTQQAPAAIANDPPQTTPRVNTAQPRQLPTRPGIPRTTTPRTAAPATPRPSVVARPTQPVIDYCTLCVSTLASIEHPLQVGSLARHAALGGGGYGMGGDIRTYAANPFIVDSYSLTINPAYADRYRNAVFVNAGSVAGPNSQPLSNFGGPFIGAIFDISPRVTVGGMVSFESFPGIGAVNTDVVNIIALTSFLGLANQYPGGPAPLPGFAQLRARNTGQLQVTYNTGDGKGGVAMGAGVSFTTTSLAPLAVDPRPQPAANITQIGFNAGVLITTNNVSILDLSGTLLLPRVVLPIPGSTNGTLGFNSTILGLNARYISRISREFTLIPMANLYAIQSGSPYYGNVLGIDAGIGFNYTTGPFFFVGGISISSNAGGNPPSQSVIGATIVSSELIVPRWNIGAEYTVVDWLRLRAGYAGYSSTARSSDVVFPSYFGYALSEGVSLGLGLVFGNFSLDVTTDTRILRQGLGNIGSGQPTFGFVSANFRF
ncbi:MAG: hypothetical protein RML40_01175 [Bacteroidota bacterium]|nr:hypothetical protein [Candidatus Kapabacteria bacterium]MDW8219120.1 hypothetical protein [Bacteroidota bacterium]